jgi:hypothetical protein
MVSVGAEDSDLDEFPVQTNGEQDGGGMME